MRPLDAARKTVRAFGRVLHLTLRVAGWLFVLTVLALGGLGVYAYRRFSPDDARRLAQEQLSALLKREVSVDRIVLSPSGLKVLGLRVRRGGAQPDILSCGSALVTVRLKPLLDKRVEIETVRLESPRISLIRDATGRWDVTDLFTSSGTARGSSSALVYQALSTAKVSVSDGLLSVEDRARRHKFSLEKLSLDFERFSANRPFPAKTNFSTRVLLAGRDVPADVTAEGSVNLADFHLSSASARVERFSGRLAGVPLSGSLDLRSFLNPRAEGRADVPALDAAQLKALFARDLPLSVPASRWSFKGGLPASGLLDVQRLRGETAEGSVTASGVFDFAADTPTLSVEAAFADVPLARAAQRWTPWSKLGLAGTASLRVDATGWPGRLQAREAELSLRGFGVTRDGRAVEAADIDASATDEFSRVQATVARGRVKALDRVFDDVSGAVKIDGRRLTVDALAFTLEGSRVKLRARVDRFFDPRGGARVSAPKEVVLSGSVDKIDWEKAAKLVEDVRAAISTRTAAAAAEEDRPWLRTFKYSIPRGFPNTSGSVKVGEVVHPNFTCRNVELLWSLRGITPELNKLDGETYLSFGPGHVKDLATAQEANTFLRVVFLPFVFMYKMNNLSVFSGATAYPKSFDFDKIDGEYGATRGVATIRYFSVSGPQFVAYAQGTADGGRELVDMNILTRLTSFRSALPEWWVDEAGRPAIGFRVKGDINHPDLEPRFRKIGDKEIEQDVAAGRAGAKKRFLALVRRLNF